MPKNDLVKLVIDDRYLNSVTGFRNYSWPLEPVRKITTRVNGNFLSVSDLSCAYHQVPLGFETRKLTSFFIGGRQKTFTRGFHCLCGLPNIFSRLMTIHFNPKIRKEQANTYIDETIMQSQTRGEMFTIINEYHTLPRKAGLKAAPDKTFFFLKKKKVLGTRYLTRREWTNSRARGCLEKLFSRNISIEENQKHQLQHKRISRDIELYDGNGTPVTYQIQHDDNPNDSCNDFYPIKYQRGSKGKILRLQKDGEDFTVSSRLVDISITSIQQASDCFQMGRFINQFKRICGPQTQSNASVNNSNTEYSLINSLSPSKYDTAVSTSPGDDSHDISTDSEDDNIVCDISIQADQARLCPAKQGQD